MSASFDFFSCLKLVKHHESTEVVCFTEQKNGEFVEDMAELHLAGCCDEPSGQHVCVTDGVSQS